MRHLNLLLTGSFAVLAAASFVACADDATTGENTGTSTDSSNTSGTSTNSDPTDTGPSGSTDISTSSTDTSTTSIETTSTTSTITDTCSWTTDSSSSTIQICLDDDDDDDDDNDDDNDDNTNTSDGDGTDGTKGDGTSSTSSSTTTDPRLCSCAGTVDNEEILLLGANKHIYRFNPNAGSQEQAASAFAELIGPGCDALETPFSLALRADGTAIVSDTDGDLFSVVLKTGTVACSPIAYANGEKASAQHPEELKDNRLALAVRSGIVNEQCEETLFFHSYAGAGVGHPNGVGYLGTINTASGVLSLVGDAPNAQAEIAFDGNGNLFAATVFAADFMATSEIVNLDADNAEPVLGSTPVELAAIHSERSYAYARSSDKDYVFYDTSVSTSSVHAVDTTYVSIPVRIVGAAVMHCED